MLYARNAWNHAIYSYILFHLLHLFIGLCFLSICFAYKTSRDDM